MLYNNILLHFSSGLKKAKNPLLSTHWKIKFNSQPMELGWLSWHVWLMECDRKHIPGLLSFGDKKPSSLGLWNTCSYRLRLPGNNYDPSEASMLEGPYRKKREADAIKPPVVSPDIREQTQIPSLFSTCLNSWPTKLWEMIINLCCCQLKKMEAHVGH